MYIIVQIFRMQYFYLRLKFFVLWFTHLLYMSPKLNTSDTFKQYWFRRDENIFTVRVVDVWWCVQNFNFLALFNKTEDNIILIFHNLKKVTMVYSSNTIKQKKQQQYFITIWNSFVIVLASLYMVFLTSSCNVIEMLLFVQILKTSQLLIWYLHGVIFNLCDTILNRCHIEMIKKLS